jgi:predicted XRE-type DNA-binding protein
LEIRVKGELHRDLLQCIHSRDLSQRELANLLEVHQPDVSNLLNGRISKFSMGKLIRFAGKLSLDATITLTQPKAVKLPTVQAGRATRKTTASV